MNLRKFIVATCFAVILCGIAGMAAKGDNMSDVYTGLRNMALGMPPDAFGQSASLPASRPYAVITDISLNHGVATVVAGLSGQASIYVSSGGGYIGGEGNAKVSAAAKAAAQAAASVLSEMHPTKEYPLPKDGDVNFYVLTTAGVMTATTAESALRDTSRPLGRLFDAVQEVITQYRLSQQH